MKHHNRLLLSTSFYALSLALGLSPDVRLPLTAVRPETATAIREAMLGLSDAEFSIAQSRLAAAANAQRQF